MKMDWEMTALNHLIENAIEELTTDFEMYGLPGQRYPKPFKAWRNRHRVGTLRWVQAQMLISL